MVIRANFLPMMTKDFLPESPHNKTCAGILLTDTGNFIGYV